MRGRGIRDNRVQQSPWTALDIVRVSERTLETDVPVVSTCRSASSSPSSWRPWRVRRASARSTSTGWRRASPRRLVRVRVRVRVRVGVGVKARAGVRVTVSVRVRVGVRVGVRPTVGDELGAEAAQEEALHAVLSDDGRDRRHVGERDLGRLLLGLDHADRVGDDVRNGLVRGKVRVRIRVRVRSGSGLGKTVREDPAQDRMAVRTDEQRPMKALRTMVMTTLSLEGAGILASR